MIKIYNIELDENNYFTGSYADFGTVPNGVNIETLPPTEDAIKVKFYQYNFDTKVWTLDEVKYNEWLASQVIVPTTEDKIASLENENMNLKTDIKSTKEVLQMLLFGEI